MERRKREMNTKMEKIGKGKEGKDEKKGKKMMNGKRYEGKEEKKK